MLESLLREFFQFFLGPMGHTEETIQATDLLKHRIPLPSEVRQDVPLAWPVMLDYFLLK